MWFGEHLIISRCIVAHAMAIDAAADTACQFTGMESCAALLRCLHVLHVLVEVLLCKFVSPRSAG